MNNKYILIACLIVGIAWDNQAQKHDYIQLLGYYDGSSHPLIGGSELNFNYAPPLIRVSPHKISFHAQNSTCSDSSGNLIFYTNGISIQNAAHDLMENGDTINPGILRDASAMEGYRVVAGCFSLPAPGRPNHYYLFHIAAETQLNRYLLCPLYYTLIDMNANNGLGRVIAKNQVMLPCYGMYAHPVAVKHGNGRDWWIISGDLEEPLIYTFLLNPEGLHGPFKTQMTYSFPGPDVSGFSAISPDGQIYVRGDAGNGLYIYNFNRCTGEFYNLRIIPVNYGTQFGNIFTFSPNSRYLYMPSIFLITILDLSHLNIDYYSIDTISQFDGFSSPKPPFFSFLYIPTLAPDGKIYFSTGNGTLHLHIMHNPDLPGYACDMHQHGLELPKYNGGATISIYPNYRLGEWEGSPCDTLNGQRPGDGFTHLPYEPPAEVQRKEGYTLLPPIGKPLPPGQTPPEIPLLDFVLPPWEDFGRRPGQLPLPQQAEKPTPDHR